MKLSVVVVVVVVVVWSFSDLLAVLVGVPSHLLVSPYPSDLVLWVRVDTEQSSVS